MNSGSVDAREMDFFDSIGTVPSRKIERKESVKVLSQVLAN